MPSTIEYSLGHCRHAHVLVAAGERGICQLRFGAAPRALEAALRATFPEARRAPGHAPVVAWCAEIVAHLDAWDGRGGPPELPLELRGTPFQLRVWDALRAIPPGEVRTYADVAAQVGTPDGARAVANACARNPVPLLVPCHRVVPRAGGIGGYRFGQGIKRWLLQREGAEVASRERTAPALATRP